MIHGMIHRAISCLKLKTLRKMLPNVLEKLIRTYRRIDSKVCSVSSSFFIIKHRVSTGLIRSYFPENPYILQVEYYIKNSLLEGKRRTWGLNRTPRDIQNYKNGKLDGETVSYYHDGGLCSISNYKNGILNGIYKSFFSDGTP